MADTFRDKLDESYQNLMETEDVKGSVNVPEERKYVGFNAYKRAIADADVAILATPPAFRPLHFEAAVQAGKHVFMEKPMASDAPGVRKLMEAGKRADRKGLSVVAGLQFRYDRGYQELVSRLNDGAIGQIISAKVNYLIGDVSLHERQPDETELEFQMRNWHHFTWLWAGAPAGLTIHYTDIVNWVKDSYPVRAQANGGRTPGKGPEHGDVFDSFYVEYTYDDGTTLHSQTRHVNNCWISTGEKFHGTAGIASRRNGITDPQGNSLWDGPADDNPSQYQLEQDEFFASIRAGEPINDTDRAARSTMTSILGRMAAHSGKVVEWNEALNSHRSLVPAHLTFDSDPPVRPDADGNYPVPVPGKTTVV
jgi:predicted dehydrogenase